MTTRLLRLALVIAALPVGWYGLSLIWEMSTADRTSIAIWVIGGILAHDAVFAPLCLAAGHGARRVLPTRWWAPVLAAVSATVLLLLLAFPVASPRAARTQAPGEAQSSTLLDRPYGLGVTLAVLVIWALTVSIIARRRGEIRRQWVPVARGARRPPDADG